MCIQKHYFHRSRPTNLYTVSQCHSPTLNTFDTLFSDIKLIEFDVLFEEEKAPPFSFAVFLVSFERDVLPDEEEEEVVGLLRLLLSLSLES